MAWDPFQEHLVIGNPETGGQVYGVNPNDLDDYELLGTAPGMEQGIALDIVSGDIYTLADNSIGCLVHDGYGYEFETRDLPAGFHDANITSLAWMPTDADELPLWLFCRPDSNGVIYRTNHYGDRYDSSGIEIYGADEGWAGGLDITTDYDTGMHRVVTYCHTADDQDFIDVWQGQAKEFVWIQPGMRSGRIEVTGHTNEIEVHVDLAHLSEPVYPGDFLECSLELYGPHWEGELLSIVVYVVEAEEDADALPGRFTLHQNHPNPFNPATEIRFDLPVPEFVTLEVHNILGQRVQTLVHRRMEAGYHAVAFDASRLAAGVYIYRLHAGEFRSVRKMVLVK
ncbi:T9SS type A sorting domain-containing protein [bacterium]|nr:T9SS type A sorting domain-containing protein [bacterium]